MHLNSSPQFKIWKTKVLTCMHIKIASFLELGTVLYMYAFVDFCKELGFVFGCLIGLPVSITYTQIGLLSPYVMLEFLFVAYVTRPRWNSYFVMLWKKFQRTMKKSAISSMTLIFNVAVIFFRT